MIWVLLYLLLGIYVIQLKSIAIETKNLRLPNPPRGLGIWIADVCLVVYWPAVLIYWIWDSFEEWIEKKDEAYGKQV
jgi:hypothetical protein